MRAKVPTFNGLSDLPDSQTSPVLCNRQKYPLPFTTRGILFTLLLLAIFREVNSNSNRNDHALDDLLPHWRDVDELQAVLNDREYQNAHHDSADFSDTSARCS